MCGKNTKLTLCNDDFRDGECNHYADAYIVSGAGKISNRFIGHDLQNEITSIKVEPYNPRTGGAVTLFDREDCSAYSASFEF